VSVAPPPSASKFDSLVISPLRADLITSEQVYLGRVYIIVKNPISLTYFRLSRAHYEAASRFDGHANLLSIATALQHSSRYWRALPLEQAVEELAQLANQLGAFGVIQSSGHQSLRRIDSLHERRSKIRFEAIIGSILYIKKSLVDPNRLLSRMDPYFSWMFTRGYVAAFVAAAIVTLLMLAGHTQEIAEHGANFFTLQNLALTWVVFIFVKTVHEFGHGLTCKHFGGEVHEMGALFILFTPYLYCNVSDSWLLPDKTRRILVTAAGIFVEMTLAIIAAWVWVFTAPGLLHQICFNIMFTCSVSTVLFNANPLMKFDGYYMLSDALEVPNLKQKSSAAATHWAQRWLLGLRGGGPAQFFSYELSPLFGLYAVASYFYGWLVLYRISSHMFDALAPYGLDFLSRSYVWLYLFTALALPCFRLMQSTYKNPVTRQAAGRRFAQIGVGLAALLAVSWIVPWQDSVKRGAVLENAAVEPVAARTAGFLREIYVREGQKVRAGEPLAQLENLDLTADAADLEREIASYDVQRRAAMSDPSEAIRESAAAYAKLAEESRIQLGLRRWQISECTLRAPRDGIIRQGGLADLIGQYFPRGRVFCDVGSNEEYRAIISLDESQARRVTVGQPVKLRLAALSGRTYEGRIASAPISSLAKLTSGASANITGGDVPAQVSRDGSSMEPSVTHYEAEMLVSDPGGENLRAGLGGKARIETGRTTLGRWAWSHLLDVINPSVRL
jgi:putative peptide zinc metalloprotease protein